MARITEVENDLREEQQNMMRELYSGTCKDKYEWSEKFEKILKTKKRYTKVERERINKKFSGCNVILSTFNGVLEMIA